MKYLFLIGSFAISYLSFSQYINFGYTIARNNYVESITDNLSTHFNLGWEFDTSKVVFLAPFSPSGEKFDVKNKMNWNRYASGFVFGGGTSAADNDISYEINISGQTNKESGKRVNLTTGAEENFALKTKFGGVNFIAAVNPNDFVSFNFGMGAHVFKVKYSWESPTFSVKTQTAGIRYNPLTDKYKVGSRALTLTFPVGATFKVLEIGNYSIHTRLNYTFVWNSFLETNLLVYLPYRYHLNHTSFTLFAAYNF